MHWPMSSTVSPIGLDLGTHTFKAVQVKRATNGWDLVNHVTLARLSPNSPIGPEDISRLEGVLDRRGFIGRDAVIAVPPAKLLTSLLELPARAPGVPVEQIAAMEFARVHKKEPDQLTLSIWELPASARASKATYMLGVGAISTDLESHIDLVESMSLNVIAMDEPHSSAARGCMHLTGADSGLVGIIDLGWTEVTLTILMNHAIVYTRRLTDSGMAALCKEAAEMMADEGVVIQDDIWRIGFGGNSQSPQDNLELHDVLGSHFGTLATEIGKAFSYASHRYSDSNMSKVILIGGGALIPGITQHFESSLGLLAHIGEVRRPLDTSDQPGPALCSALGLALWKEEAA